MNTLHIQLKIKFRTAFITLYTANKLFDIPLTAVPVPVARDKVLFNDRGVYLRAWNTDAPATP